MPHGGHIFWGLKFVEGHQVTIFAKWFWPCSIVAMFLTDKICFASFEGDQVTVSAKLFDSD